MVKLNFLPHRLLTQKKQQQQFYRIVCLALIAGVACTMMLDALLDQHIAQQTALVQGLRNEHDKLDARLHKLNALKQQSADLAQTRQHFTALLRQQHMAPALLQVLARQTPAGVSLRELKQQTHDISLSGTASSSEDVMRLLTNLRAENGVLCRAELQEIHAEREKTGYHFVIHAGAQAPTVSDAQ